MDFLKFLWQDSRVFFIFLIFIVIFEGYGIIFTNMTLHDVVPFNLLLTALGLTITIYNWRRYNRLKNDNDLNNQSKV